MQLTESVYQLIPVTSEQTRNNLTINMRLNWSDILSCLDLILIENKSLISVAATDILVILYFSTKLIFFLGFS